MNKRLIALFGALWILAFLFLAVIDKKRGGKSNLELLAVAALLSGMWLVNLLRSELCPDKPWNEITAEAEEKHFDYLVDVNDPVFLAPESMKDAFDSKLPHPPKCTAGYFRCAYRSLAQGYRQAIEEIERNTGKEYRKLYIVGGGARNRYLNRLTEETTGKQVIALPIEATALGNISIQTEAEEA